MNGRQQQTGTAQEDPHPPLDFSDNEGDEGSQDEQGGDYSTRLEELMSDGDEENSAAHDQDAEEEEEGFFYSGVDAEPTGTYKDQLRDVLGPDHDEDESEEVEVENSLMHEVEENEKFAASLDDEARHNDVQSDHSFSASSASQSGLVTTSPRVVVSSMPGTPSRMTKPFLHPSISRLRSTTPQASPSPSVGSVGTLNSHMGVPSAAPSHFSALSGGTSLVNTPDGLGESKSEREVFRWTQLRVVGDYIYRQYSQKAATVLGSPSVGSPTVLAANGLVCVGTDLGKILVFDFKQNLKCICGGDSSDRTIGPVTALALSFDHTYVAAGHASGHIQLFDIRSPKSPARFVPPTTLPAVASGRQEGHLLGSRIVSIGFVAGRHTAVVSADDRGLAFYHSLGKVLFVDAPDILRILGKYPDEGPPDLPPGVNPSHNTFRRRKMRQGNTILSMAPLPLGTSPHSTDAYNLTALLTPVKLIIVGLKPTPKTWYRRPRENADDVGSKSRFKGTLAWFPSIVPGQSAQDDRPNGKATSNGANHPPGTTPILVYSWGNALNLIRVSESKIVEQTRNPKTGKTTSVEVGRIVFEEAGGWTSESDILSVQWLNVNQIIVLTATALEVYDIHSHRLVEHVLFDAWSLVSPILSHTTNGSISYSDAVTEVAHSMRVYKGKIFLLGQRELQVGTLLTWADRILSFVENGDFLSAIELTRAYYVGTAPGNRNGLPDEPEELRGVVGGKMRELMVASARYAFSEDRMTDGTHMTPDGRGVDRTDLFESLVATCARACIALDDFEFLFEDLFQYYDANAIPRIFLRQLEPFILDGSIHEVPPRITQRLIALHDENQRPDLAERVIWHIDPDCLDINQAITLCQNYHLYDALIYVFTRAMKDYVSPVVELLGLIRRVHQFRRMRAEASPNSRARLDDDSIEPVILNAYKIYPYLANVLTGLTYPSEEPLPEEEALAARDDVYTFLFFGRSSVWPEGDGGKLVLTSDEENGVEPTYPYARLLLRFDAEAFLHTLDLAFEDSYLNDKTRPVNRLVIVKILFEILSSGISPADATFVNIFIARNVPKYPQFIQMAPSALQNILINLANVEDDSTREDRQLAAEYLLSAYTPHESDRILRLFEKAGFYRILRSWHRQERQWSPLLLAYLQDPHLPTSEVFPSVDSVLTIASNHNKGKLPPEILVTVVDSLPALLAASVTNTASLIDRRLPALHEKALEALGLEAARERFGYLRFLLGSPDSFEDDGYHELLRKGDPSTHVPSALRQEYIALHCEIIPSGVIRELRYLPPDFLDWPRVLQACEEHKVYDAVIWALNHRGEPRAALAKAETFDKLLSTKLAQALVSSEAEAQNDVETLLSALKTIGSVAVALCLERSQSVSSAEVPSEDIWFTLLKSQISCVHRVSLCCSPGAMASDDEGSSQDSAVQRERQALSALRSLVQDTFTALMSISSTKAVSFPRLFKRLVDSAKDNEASKGALYNEFRAVLTGMLESYRTEGDLLVITKRLIDRDLFFAMEDMSKDRQRGWAPSQGACSTCRESFFDNKRSASSSTVQAEAGLRIVVTRTGAIYHRKCLPPDVHSIATHVH